MQEPEDFPSSRPLVRGMGIYQPYIPGNRSTDGTGPQNGAQVYSSGYAASRQSDLRSPPQGFPLPDLSPTALGGGRAQFEKCSMICTSKASRAVIPAYSGLCITNWVHEICNGRPLCLRHLGAFLRSMPFGPSSGTNRISGNR